MAAEKLRDLSQPMDVALLDATVSAFYGTGSKEERAAADHILRDLQHNPDMWLQVVHILSSAQNLNTKFFALQVLEGVIKYRWNALPVEQRDGMKNYISDVIVKLSSDEVSFQRERLYVNKLNIILVQILKHEWPARWRSFIPDLVAAAKSSETICENCMAILKLLSEEVFDFSRGEMTQQKIKELKQSLNRHREHKARSEFKLIHELCLYVLSASQRAELIRATLATLHAFLSWIPLGYIFESPLLENLLKFFPVPAYRNLTIQCLTEVAALSFGDFYNMEYAKMYSIFMVQLQAIVPSSTNFVEAYANGNSEEQAFIQNLALFFTSFYKCHIRVLESVQENINILLVGLEYLINISYVDDIEVFKVCLDYWNSLVSELFDSNHNLDSPAGVAHMMGLQLAYGDVNAAFLVSKQMPMLPGMVDGLGSQLLQRRQLYTGPMSKLRLLMICRMAKPEEVLIVEDENGNIVRETMKDNDVLVQYKIMRETLIYLAHLDHEDTEKQMLTKLGKQLIGEDFTWNNLNTLCWAIGSISGSMAEEQENRFLVMVIRDLLNLCEITKGKDNKAVIASNIMYVVGQYQRFLRAHWKFLKTVVNKLFEFMHETHPGVQDMACDTFLKIVQKCKRKFVIVQVMIHVLLYLAMSSVVGTMIQAETDPLRRGEYLQKLMELPNQKWTEIIGQARQSVDFLKDQDVIRAVLNILQIADLLHICWNGQLKPHDIHAYLCIYTYVYCNTNTSVASSLGMYFMPQISMIFLDMLNVYRMYSELISTSIAQGGPHASRTSIVKLLRSVKRETLKLIETFLEKAETFTDKAEDQQHIGKQFLPPMMDHVLGDYARNLPDARESERFTRFPGNVLNCAYMKSLAVICSIIEHDFILAGILYKGTMIENVPRIFESVFQCTLEMITKNFEDYPEHRLKFFSLLRAIAAHCFPALVHLSSEVLSYYLLWFFCSYVQQLKLVLDSIIWAFRHTERNIAETGLNLLLEMLTNFQGSEFCNQFHRTYFLTIEQEIFAVLTDTFHKPGFKLHVLVLQHLFSLVTAFLFLFISGCSFCTLFVLANLLTGRSDEVESAALTEPIWDTATVSYPYANNGMFVREYTVKLLSSSFPNMTATEVTQFVNGLFESKGDISSFKDHIRDFLVQSKEFSAQDNKDLYAEEAAAKREKERQRMLSIPGLIAPNEIQDEMVDS
ncbi:hypothetical protein SASPL_107470 [Salvia splendens]|uniref:Importin N-terminal domain-containing protein n=1 Tax=Salvia splendens TaxID=180675 RepID=A0A8X9A7B4_SALSN|nr:hypothetical protein SASPL_107470 [Salvia splendens]